MFIQFFVFKYTYIYIIHICFTPLCARSWLFEVDDCGDAHRKRLNDDLRPGLAGEARDLTKEHGEIHSEHGDIHGYPRDILRCTETFIFIYTYHQQQFLMFDSMIFGCV